MLTALFLIAMQASAPAPDIELNVRATARSVKIERKGETKLEARAGPDAGSRTETRVIPPAEGKTELTNVTFELHAEARIGESRENPPEAETSTPQ